VDSIASGQIEFTSFLSCNLPAHALCTSYLVQYALSVECKTWMDAGTAMLAHPLGVMARQGD
jgi:hypothetical protein